MSIRGLDQKVLRFMSCCSAAVLPFEILLLQHSSTSEQQPQ